MSLPASQDQIQASDYNELQLAVQLLLGDGVGSRGYGQSQLIASSQIVETNGEFPVITRTQWNQLRQDIGLIRQHQTGTFPALIDLDSRLQIDADVNQNFDNILNASDANRFQIAAPRSVTASKASENFTGQWSVSANTQVTINFNTADNARWFFNSGGKIRFFSQRSGGSSTPQNTTWTSLLNNIGTVSFSANAPSVNFYSLTDQDQVSYEFKVGDVLPTSVYSNNDMKYRISVRSNVANNSNGGATQLIFTVDWLDNYTPGSFPGGGPILNPDLVDGTLSLAVSETKAAAPFVIDSPSYSISSITAS